MTSGRVAGGRVSLGGIVGPAGAIALLVLLARVGLAGEGEAAPGKADGPPPAKTITNTLGMKLIQIAPGSFQMGDDNARPVHKVTISRPFYLGATEVTQAQWEAVMGNNPSYWKGRDLPVETVSWNDCVDFCRRLTDREQAEGKIPKSARYRLPTEAEWEYACRAGSTTRFCFGDDEGGLTEYAWFHGNSPRSTRPVGTQKANAWGLYDMHGNVCEWCSDWYGPYPAGDQKDPVGPPNGEFRVLRGGAWGYAPTACRSAARGRSSPGARLNGVGFRLARPLP